MPLSDGSNYERAIMKPIIEREDFQKLRNAGLIWFDHNMNPDNIYGFHIPRLVKLAEAILSEEIDYDTLHPTIGEEE